MDARIRFEKGIVNGTQVCTLGVDLSPRRIVGTSDILIFLLSDVLSYSKNSIGLHYTSKAMGQPTSRPGAIMDFASRGIQEWTALEDPYDEIVFPFDKDTKKGLPNHQTYSFVSGAQLTVDQIVDRIDPKNEELRKRAKEYMDICMDIHSGFVALGVSRILPSWLQFLVQGRVDRLMKYASLTVRDVQHLVLKLGYTKDQLLKLDFKDIPKAPEGTEPDTSVRRLAAVLTHPIGDYAVQPREATMAAHGMYVDFTIFVVFVAKLIFYV